MVEPFLFYAIGTKSQTCCCYIKASTVGFIVTAVISVPVGIALLIVGGVQSDHAYIRAGVGLLVSGVIEGVIAAVILVGSTKCCNHCVEQ